MVATETETKMVSSTPPAIQRRGKFVCPVDGCEKPFDGQRQYQMHYFRKHDEEFKRNWTRRVKGGSSTAAPTAPKAVSGNMLNLIMSVLGKTKKSMSLDEILAGIKSIGFQGKGQDSSTKTYIAQVVRKNPQSGVQYADGLYSINRTGTSAPTTKSVKARRKQKVVVEPTPAPDVSLETELALARRQAQRSQEIAMKLFEAVMLAMN